MSNIVSLIFYIFSFSLSSICYFLYQKFNKKVFLAISFVIPLLIGGLRYGVGTDYFSYLSFAEHDFNIDFGFTAINYIAKSLNNYMLIFIIYSFLTLLFFYIGLKNTPERSRPLVLFLFLLLFFTVSFNAMRQILSVSIFFCLIDTLKKRQTIKYYILAIVATMFHTASLILFLIYPFFISKKKSIRFLCLIGAFLFSIYPSIIISQISSTHSLSHFSIYSEYTDRPANNLSFILELITFIVILFFYRTLKKSDEYVNLNLSLYALGVILGLSGFYNPFVKRMSLYFCLPSIVLLGGLPFLFKDEKNKLLLFILIICYAISRFTLSAYILKQGNLIPYNFI